MKSKSKYFLRGPSRKVLSGSSNFSCQENGCDNWNPMAKICLLTSLVRLNRIERALILADRLEKVPPLGRCNTSHYTNPTHFLTWCLAVKKLQNYMRWPWQPPWTMRQERKPCSKDSKTKEKRRWFPAHHECAISALNGWLPHFFCARERKSIVCHSSFWFLLLAANC